jgi:hypothetical protein
MLCLALSLLLFTSGIVAETADFYEAEVPATDGEAGRERALAAALQVVVRQVTGDPEVAASPQLAPEYETAARYARTWRVVDAPDGSRLEVAFDQAAVDAMLASHGLAPRADRPSVLIWMAGPDEGGDRLLMPEMDAAAWNGIRAGSVRGGVSMLQPLLDLEDQSRLPPADISARVPTTLREASARYAPDAAVSVYLAAGDGRWNADWLLLSGETTRRWSTRGLDQATVLEAGMKDVTGILSTLFPVSARRPLDLSLPPGAAAVASSAPATAASPASAPVPAPIVAGEGQVLVRVSGISGPGDYGRVVALFRNNAAVAAHRVVASEADAVVVSVTPRGDQPALAQALGAEEILEPESAAAAGQGAVSTYRLKP